MTIGVVLAEDMFLERTAVTHLLAESRDIDLLASAADGATLMAAVEELEPEVVVTGIRLPPTRTDEGIRIAAELRERRPDVGVVVLSRYARPEFVVGLLGNGSARRAYLLTERVHNGGELVSAVRAVAEGGSFVDPTLVELLVEGRAREAHCRLGDLTARELETLAQIAQGKSNEAIAQSLCMTKRAVEKHVNSIFMKLNLVDVPAVARRVKATLMFLEEHDRPGRAGGGPAAASPRSVRRTASRGAPARGGLSATTPPHGR